MNDETNINADGVSSAMGKAAVITAHLEHLTKIKTQHERVQKLIKDKEVKYAQHKEAVAKADADRTELIETPAPGTKQDLLKHVRAIQTSHQELKEAKAGYDTDKAHYMGAAGVVTLGRKRLEVLLDADPLQMDMFGGMGGGADAGGDDDDDGDVNGDNQAPVDNTGDDSFMGN